MKTAIESNNPYPAAYNNWGIPDIVAAQTFCYSLILFAALSFIFTAILSVDFILGAIALSLSVTLVLTLTYLSVLQMLHRIDAKIDSQRT